jgi:hypothetical protein
VGIMFVVLAFAVPPIHAFALIAGTAVAVGLVASKVRRERAESRPLERVKARV